MPTFPAESWHGPHDNGGQCLRIGVSIRRQTGNWHRTVCSVNWLGRASHITVLAQASTLSSQRESLVLIPDQYQ